MKSIKIVLLSLPLVFAGCSESTEQTPTASAETPAPATPEAAPKPDLKAQAKTWTEETKKLGQSAWETTKDTAGDVADKSKTYYENAKDKAADVVSATRDKSAEIYQSAKEKGGDMLETAKEKGGDIVTSTKEKAGELYDAGKEKVGIAGDTGQPAADGMPATTPDTGTSGSMPETTLPEGMAKPDQ